MPKEVYSVMQSVIKSGPWTQFYLQIRSLNMYLDSLSGPTGESQYKRIQTIKIFERICSVLRILAILQK